MARDLPGVGQHLQDHLSGPVIRATNDPITLLSAESLSNLVKYLARRKGMLTSADRNPSTPRTAARDPRPPAG